MEGRWVQLLGCEKRVSDAEMQALAKLFADEFNKLNPPKKVDFVEASLIKCLEDRMAGNFTEYLG